MTRANNWGAELIRGNITELKDGEQWSCALDKIDNYLYIRNHVGVFVRVNLKEKDDNGNLKVENCWKLILIWVEEHSIIWLIARWEDCFYAAEDYGQVVLKIYKDEQGTWHQDVCRCFE